MAVIWNIEKISPRNGTRNCWGQVLNQAHGKRIKYINIWKSKTSYIDKDTGRWVNLIKGAMKIWFCINFLSKVGIQIINRNKDWG